MALIVMASNFKNSIANTPQVAYESPEDGGGTQIVAVTVTNNTEFSAYAYSIYISAPGDTEPPEDPLRPIKIVRNKSDYALGLVGQLIPAGGKLWFESSQPNSLSCYITGESI